VPPGVTVGSVSALVPLARTRAERFDDLVLDAVAHLETTWAEQLRHIEFAVEDVPPLALLRDLSAGGEPFDRDVVFDDTAGGPVPLGQLLPGTDGRHARIVVYRRPIEARADDLFDLAELVHEVVIDQVARLLDVDPDQLDPD
jgi:predicted Zn-dependent protease with MMP-like domain